MFSVGDLVIDITGRGEGTVTYIETGSMFGIQTSFGCTYTETGYYSLTDSAPSLKPYKDSAECKCTTIESVAGIATIVTLSDGTRIYHPHQGQPFILPTTQILY